MGFGCNGDVMLIYFCSFFYSNSAFNQEIDPVTALANKMFVNVVIGCACEGQEQESCQRALVT